MHKIKILIILIIFSLGENVYSNSSDSLLIKYGLPTEIFKIILVKDAPKDVFKNLHSDLIKPTDTIIIATIDTFSNKLNIEGKILHHRLILSGKVFKKGVSFYKTKFNNEVFMNECTFFDRVNFSKTNFESTLILWKTHFVEAGIFTDAIFHGIEFQDSRFEEDAQFHGAKFLGRTFFNTTEFFKGAYFSDAVFNEYTRFSGNDFAQRPWFWESSFLDTVIFCSNNFRDGIDFQSAKFSHYLSLRSSTSKGRIDFGGVKMPKKLDISYLKTDGPVDFSYINDTLADYLYKINIYSAEIERLILTDKFSLYFDDYLSPDIKNGIYKQLLESLNNKGYKNVFKSFDIEYRSFKNENFNHFFEKIFFSINKLWWNFGYCKQRVFLWATFFIFLFSIPIRFWFNTFVINVYSIKMLKKRFKKNNQITNPISRFFLNYLVSLIYTVFIFFNFKLDFDNLSFDKYLAGIFILLIYSIGLICTAFIINLIITV